MHGRPRSFWIPLVAAIERGADLYQTADRHGVNASTLAWWRTVIRRERRVALPEMLPVVVRQAPPAEATVAGTHVELLVAGASLPRPGRHRRALRRRARARTGARVLSVGPGTRVFLAVEPIDLRRGHDGLCNVVKAMLGHDPYAGALFVFFGRRGDRIKVFYWERGGFIVHYKRLERGRFQRPRIEPGAKEVRLDGTALAMLLDGIDLRHVRRPSHWEPPETPPARR